MNILELPSHIPLKSGFHIKNKEQHELALCIVMPFLNIQSLNQYQKDYILELNYNYILIIDKNDFGDKMIYISNISYCSESVKILDYSLIYTL